MAGRTPQEILEQREAWMSRKAARAAGQDIPILPPLKPGETVIIKADDASTKYLRKAFEERIGIDATAAVMSELVLSIQTISFGDGTGYIIGHEYPVKKTSQK